MTASRTGIVALAVALSLAAACGGDSELPTICEEGRTACGQVCLDVATDPLNCGGCGIPCSAEQSCLGGACVCAPGLVDCNGSCLPVGAAECGPAPGALSLVTSAPGAYWQTDGQLAEVTSASADVTVRDAATAQTWEGFGGAFNEMGWEALSVLPAGDRDTAIRLLFGADGARFAFGRIPIGATDYAIDRYTLDETAGDAALAGFSIDRDLQRLIPYVKAAQAVKRNIRFWASPWTPPTWMKQGPFSPGDAVSPFDGGTMKGDDATLAAFAQYLIRFVQAYAQQGIPIETIAPQNEASYTGNYPTCRWSPATYGKLFSEILAPAIAEAGLTTKLMLGTFSDPGSDPSIVGSVMGDATARGTVGVLGYQWGMQSQVGGARRYSLPVWQTEHRCGNYPWATPFDADMAPNDHAYAVESWGLVRDWIRAGVTAYSVWNMVLDTRGVGIDTTRVWPQNALLTVDASAKVLNVTPAYYVFRHLSQFVATGAKVAATAGGDAIAFKNPDGSTVAVLYNAGAARTVTVAIAGRKLQLAMPSNGWATVVAR